MNFNKKTVLSSIVFAAVTLSSAAVFANTQSAHRAGWVDVTKEAGAASTCAQSAENCTMKDEATGLNWSKLQGTNVTADDAIASCQNLAYNGESDWRLPTKEELVTAFNHNAKSAASAHWMTPVEISAGYWSSTPVANVANDFWYVSPGMGYAYYEARTWDMHVVCVRK